MGVDISASRIRLLELDGRGDTHRVLSYASEPLPAEAIANEQIVDAEAVAASMKRALERSGSRTRRAAIAVSGPAVISKIIDMPAELGDAEIEQQIAFDAEQYIPHPKEEVNLDFQVLERDTNNPDVNRVLLVACRRDHVEARVGAMEMAGLEVCIVDIETYALQNACSLLIEQSPALAAAGANVAVFDLGAQQTRLSVSHGGRNVYSRELSFGGRQLAGDLLERHDLSEIDQLRGRLRTGEIAPEAIADEVDEFAHRAAGQIERALQFYMSAGSQEETIDQVVLVGGTTLFPGIEEAVASRLSWPVTVGNPLAGMLAGTAARRNHVDYDGPALMVATGLAMRSVR